MERQADTSGGSDGGHPPIRVDFALTVHTGNRTRYETIRPIIDSDPSVVARWYPIRTWVQDDWLRFVPLLPGGARLRIRHLLDSWKLFARPTADAVVVHAFETYYLFAYWRQLVKPTMGMINHPDGYVRVNRHTRFALARTDFMVPWNSFMRADFEQRFPDYPKDRIVVMHPGIDLRKWPQREQKPPSERFSLLFVGADLQRKGADTLLDAFETSLADTCSLDIATISKTLPEEFRARVERLPHCRLHLDHSPGSDQLMALFRQADLLVLPTRSDSSPFVILEAMATGVPVISTPIVGIPDMVIDGETGLLVPTDDPNAIARAVERLRANPELARGMSEKARAHVEAHFDARANCARLVEMAREAVRQRRSAAKRGKPVA